MQKSKEKREIEQQQPEKLQIQTMRSKEELDKKYRNVQDELFQVKLQLQQADTELHRQRIQILDTETALKKLARIAIQADPVKVFEDAAQILQSSSCISLDDQECGRILSGPFQEYYDKNLQLKGKKSIPWFIRDMRNRMVHGSELAASCNEYAHDRYPTVADMKKSMQILHAIEKRWRHNYPRFDGY